MYMWTAWVQYYQWFSNICPLGAHVYSGLKSKKNKDSKKYKNGIRKPMALVATNENP